MSVQKSPKYASERGKQRAARQLTAFITGTMLGRASGLVFLRQFRRHGYSRIQVQGAFVLREEERRNKVHICTVAGDVMVIGADKPKPAAGPCGGSGDAVGRGDPFGCGKVRKDQESGP